MEFYLASAIGLLATVGLRLACEGRGLPLLLGAGLLSQAGVLLLFASGQLVRNLPPVIGKEALPAADPLPQALALVAMVTGLALTLLAAGLALRARRGGGRER